MKSPLDSLDYIYWFIDSVLYKDNELFIKLIEASVSDKKENLVITEEVSINDVYAIEPNENGRKVTIHFEDVILYQAFDECSHLMETEVCSEGVVSKCENTSLLNYVKEHTLLFDTTVGDFTHYCVKTAEDWYHVLSREDPKFYENKTA